MKILTLVAPKKAGLVAEVARVLGASGINLESFEANSVKELDLVTLTVDEYDKALEVLRDAGYNAVSDDAAVVCIRDEPGSLARVAERLHQNGYVMSSIRILHRHDGLALVAIAVERRADALHLIRDLLVSDK
jgi:hypothetical protein